MSRVRKHIFNCDEAVFEGDGEVELCPICHQEFTGFCPLNSAKCPNMDQIEDEEEEDEDEEPDFDDVKKLDSILEEDKEAEKLVEEEGDIPPEDLEDE
ncbi:MAG: hypothetical protein V1929_10465 [bacterium]